MRIKIVREKEKASGGMQAVIELERRVMNLIENAWEMVTSVGI